MRPSTQVVTLRFRRCVADGFNKSNDNASNSSRDSAPEEEDGTPVEGTLDWPEEQASVEFRGRVLFNNSSCSSSSASNLISDAGSAVVPAAVLTLEGKVGEIIQGAPERVGWMAGADIRGTFSKEGTDGTVKGSWSARAPATTLEPLGAGGMRLNVGLLPDRLLAAEAAEHELEKLVAGAGEGFVGSSADPVMGSLCR